MNALVTGASGFVGSRVAQRLLTRGDGVRAIVRRPGAAGAVAPIDEVVGDFADPAVATSASAGMDWVVHAAATAGPDLEAVRGVNAEGTRSMTEAALAAGARRFVHISTMSVYETAGLQEVDERSPLKTSGDPYGLTKAEADRVVLAAMPRGLPATILRPGAILGVHPTSTWAVRMPSRIRDREVKLKLDGATTIPFVHVEDLVDAILLAVETDRAIGAVYNVFDEIVTWRAYTDEVRSWFGSPPLDRIPNAELPPGGDWNGTYAARRIRDKLGYRPRRTYAEGMADAERYWREQRVSA